MLTEVAALPVPPLEDAPQLFDHKMVGQIVDARILYQKGTRGKAGVQRITTRLCRDLLPQQQ